MAQIKVVAYTPKVAAAINRMLNRSGFGVDYGGGRAVAAAEAENNGGVVLAKITGGDALTGYTVELYGHGRFKPPTGEGVLFATEIAAGAQVPAGTFCLAHFSQFSVAGGNPAEE